MFWRAVRGTFRIGALILAALGLLVVSYFIAALGALAGLHDTAIRVVAVDQPAGEADCQSLRVDRAGRQALIDHIGASLANPAMPQPVAQSGFEAYYLAKGRYGLLRTCNQWVSEALAAAGLPHAGFAPFSFSILWPLVEKRQSGMQKAY